MPHIRAVLDYQTPTEREVWLEITDYSIDPKTSYLTLFRVHYSDGTVKDLHLFRRDTSLLDVAVGIFGGLTTLRSAKGLLQDLNKAAGKSGWHGKAGAAGMVFGSASMLYEFLKSQPFRQEGYYDGSGNLFLGRTINTKNAKDYDPD